MSWSWVSWENIGRADNLLGIIAAFVTLITLLRVSSIAAARKEERQLLARALRLRELTNSLSQNATLLGNPTNLEETRSDLLLLSSELHAALRILLPEDSAEVAMQDVRIVADGYWTDAFAARLALEAKRRVIVVTWRNSRILGVELLQRLITRLTTNTGLSVEIFALSSEASTEVCENLSRMLPLADPASVCSEQLHNRNLAKALIGKQIAAGTLGSQVAERFKYFEYKAMPFIHCVIADDNVYWGINFYMDSTAGASDLLSKAYIAGSVRSDFGRKIMEQVDVVRRLSERIDLTN